MTAQSINQSARSKAWAPPSYPYLGGGSTSAKIVLEAERSGVFAAEVAFAVLAHKDSKKQVSFRKTSLGTIITANVGEMPVSILAEESEHFPNIRHRRTGGF